MTNDIIIKKIPSLKILVALCVGILLQFHFNLSNIIGIYTSIIALALTTIFSFLPSFYQLKFAWLKGFFINSLFIGIGLLLSFYNNCQNNDYAALKFNAASNKVIVTLKDKIVAREKSYKCLATINAIQFNNKWQKVNGDLLIYFNKKSDVSQLQYGSTIVVYKNIFKIVNSGNPGGFNYAQYCYFQNIQYQAFLKQNDFTLLHFKNTNWFTNFTIHLREKILKILENNIKNKSELSVAEALLIGYREDLDKDVVKAYSNTGVVHIIAISGLHLGMIYGLILFLFKPFSKYKWSRIVKPLTVLIVLWLFTCIAGMAPSILRSSIMFSVIAIAEAINKKNNIYNNLALSAIIILIINPFSLWDVGFQLSYSAVLSIVLFSRYIKNWFYFNNKFANKIWELNSITLSAQILTLPIVLYHFHQFPILFLFTNFVAVPLSGLILYSEILLLVISFIKPFAAIVGWVIEILIKGMNIFILWANSLKYVVIESIQINIWQAVILMLVLIFITHFFVKRNGKSLLFGLSFLIVFLSIRTIDFIQKSNQQKLIIYNVPNHTAIDIVQGNKYKFVGDSILNVDGFLRNFHIKPSRILNRLYQVDSNNHIHHNNGFLYSNNKVIAIVDKPIIKSINRIKVDAVLLTKNPKLYIDNLVKLFDTKLLIIDGSNPSWKVNYWKKDCDKLGLKYFITADRGCFEMNM